MEKPLCWIIFAVQTSWRVKPAALLSISARTEVSLDSGKKITFLDTPGHEAFTAMRARGAQLTDIVVLVVAAEDNVMPQTLEAISHARAANVPIISQKQNRLTGSDPDRIRQQLADKEILVEEWEGSNQCVEVSEKKGNVELLWKKYCLKPRS